MGGQRAGVGGGFANARGGGPCDKGRVATVRALQLWKDNRLLVPEGPMLHAGMKIVVRWSVQNHSSQAR